MSFPVPEFVEYNEKEREAFLSQNGNFTPNERRLFHKMCEMWEPSIPIITIFKKLDTLLPNFQNEFTKLLTKLKTLHMGLITTIITGSKRTSQGVILCNPNAAIFFNYILHEEILNVQNNMYLQLPTVHNLNKRNIHIENTYITKISYHQLAEFYTKQEIAESTIHSLHLPSGDSLLIPTISIGKIVNIHFSKIQKYLGTDARMNLIVSVLHKTFSDIRRIIGDRDPNLWFEFCHLINNSKKNMTTNQITKFPEDFFTVSFFMEKFLSAELDILRRQKEREQKKLADIHEIANFIRDHNELSVSAKALEDHLESFKEKYPDTFEKFHHDFEKICLQPNEKKNLPTILKIQDTYIHAKKILPFFQTKIEQITPLLYRYYLRIMIQYIKGSSKQAAGIFYSIHSFEADIEERIQELDPVLFSLLKRPAVVGEAIIQSQRIPGKLLSMSDMENALIPFFYPKQIKFKELQVIFKIEVNNLYLKAFQRLGILRKIFLKILRKHNHDVRKFTDQWHNIYQRMLQKSALPPEIAEREQQRFQNASPSHWKKLRASKTFSRTRFSRKPQRLKHQYSRKEQDMAWNEFSKRLKK
ncbi:MAG: hypothetical protein ACR2PY_01855 [Salinispira sp.]